MASPPSVIKLAESPIRCITMNVIRGVTMSETVTTTALRTWPRKKKNTKLVPFYDRIELVTAAINTVRDALIEGIVLVVVK